MGGIGRLPYEGDGDGLPCRAAPSEARERKGPGGRKETLGKKKGKEEKGADRWANSAAREKERASGRMQAMKAERSKPNWIACGACAGKEKGRAKRAGASRRCRAG